MTGRGRKSTRVRNTNASSHPPICLSNLFISFLFSHRHLLCFLLLCFSSPSCHLGLFSLPTHVPDDARGLVIHSFRHFRPGSTIIYGNLRRGRSTCDCESGYQVLTSGTSLSHYRFHVGYPPMGIYLRSLDSLLGVELWRFCGEVPICWQ